MSGFSVLSQTPVQQAREEEAASQCLLSTQGSLLALAGRLGGVGAEEEEVEVGLVTFGQLFLQTDKG